MMDNHYSLFILTATCKEEQDMFNVISTGNDVCLQPAYWLLFFLFLFLVEGLLEGLLAMGICLQRT